MNRRGFALLTVLWLIAALAVIAGGSLALIRDGIKASHNRITLTRAAWAREACVEIMLARGFKVGTSHAYQVTRSTGRIDLGREAWCALDVEDPGSRLNLNLASAESLTKLMGDSLAAALLDWRDQDGDARPHGAELDWYRQERRRQPRNGPLASTQELGFVRGFDSAARERLEPLLTVWGAGTINVNTAPAEVLETANGISRQVVSLIVERRRRGQSLESLDQLLSILPPGSRAPLASRYQELVQALAFSPTELLVTATGGVGSSPLRSRIVVTAVPTIGRVAVIRRAVEQ